jgi:hypothetical protein
MRLSCSSLPLRSQSGPSHTVTMYQARLTVSPALLVRGVAPRGAGGDEPPCPSAWGDPERAGARPALDRCFSGRDPRVDRGGRNSSITRPSKYRHCKRHFG